MGGMVKVHPMVRTGLSSVVPQTPRWRWVTGIVIFAVAYAVLLLAYFNDGRSGAFEGYTDSEPPAGGVLVTMEFNGIDPVARLMAATVEVDIDGSLADPDAATGQLDVPKEALTVIVAPTADGAPLTYPAGQPMTLRQIRIPTEPGSGYIRDWPFDRYRTSMVVFTEGARGTTNRHLHRCRSMCRSAEPCRAGTSRRRRWIPTAPAGSLGRVYDIEMRRSLGVVLFGAAIVLVLISLPFLALWVVINVYRGRRKFEPAFLSWIAALLFATMTIRNFLPGSPPAGSWVDIAVVIWVMIALTVALCFGVGSWWRYSRPASDEPLADPSEPAGAEQDKPSTLVDIVCWVRLQSVAAGTVIPPAASVRSGHAHGDRHIEEHHLWR